MWEVTKGVCDINVGKDELNTEIYEADAGKYELNPNFRDDFVEMDVIFLQK